MDIIRLILKGTAIAIGLFVLVVVVSVVLLRQARNTDTGRVAAPVADIPTGAPVPTIRRNDKWIKIESKSELDGTPTVILRLRSEDEIVGWLKKETPTLEIRCYEKKTEVSIHTGMSASPELGEYQRFTVRIRLDEKQALTQKWSESTANDALFAPNAITLARQIADAKSMIFQFTPFNSNPATTHFDVRGLSDGLASVGRACGWNLRRVRTG